MSNLLLNPYSFIDSDGNQPPTCWNGTSYIPFQSTDLGLLIAPSDGDSLTFFVSSTYGNSSFRASCIGPYGDLLQLVSGSTSTVGAAYSVALPVGSTSYVLSITVAIGDLVTLTPSANPPPPGPDPGQGPAPGPSPAPLPGGAGWTNAFIAGECTVVVENLGTELFRQVMAIGDSQGFFDQLQGQQVTVDVDPEGAVSISNDTPLSAFVEYSYFLRVIPTYALVAGGVRVAGVNTWDTFAQVSATGDASSFDIDELSRSLEGWTPDPCNLSAAAPVELSVHVSGGLGL